MSAQILTGWDHPPARLGGIPWLDVLQLVQQQQQAAAEAAERAAEQAAANAPPPPTVYKVYSNIDGHLVWQGTDEDQYHLKQAEEDKAEYDKLHPPPVFNFYGTDGVLVYSGIDQAAGQAAKDKYDANIISQQAAQAAQAPGSADWLKNYQKQQQALVKPLHGWGM